MGDRLGIPSVVSFLFLRIALEAETIGREENIFILLRNVEGVM
jgi:hypothetical protein